MHRRTFLAASFALPAVLSAAPALAKKRFRFFAPAGIALGGADPVAYFEAGRAMPGRSDLALKWGGAIWCFAAEANRTAFEMNPHAYLPQYGGHCALSMAHGELRGSVPEAWTIEGGKLYLAASADYLAQFRADLSKNIALADSAWSQSAG